MVDYEPPPFFKRGPAPFALLTFYVALSAALMILDARFRYLEVLRQGASVIIQPLQAVAHLPVRVLGDGADYLGSMSALQDEAADLRRAQLEVAPRLLRLQQVEAENVHLRALLALKERQPAAGGAVRILHATRDPFVRRIVIDRGLTDKVTAGQPLIDHQGVIGQVTRVFPLISEVTLITDKEQAIPVQLVRSGLRSVAFGVGRGLLELRFLPANADVEKGDLLVTSGLDGVYHAGLPVAEVISVERDAAYSFARILCKPVAGVESFSTAMLLNPPPAVPAAPEGLDQPRIDQPAASTDLRSRVRGAGVQ